MDGARVEDADTFRQCLAPDPDTGWDRWELFLRGDRVGELFEHRTWTGSRYGGRKWIAVHNPTLAPYGSLFSPPPQRTMRAAVDLLERRVT